MSEHTGQEDCPYDCGCLEGEPKESTPQADRLLAWCDEVEREHGPVEPMIVLVCQACGGDDPCPALRGARIVREAVMALREKDLVRDPWGGGWASSVLAAMACHIGEEEKR